MPIVNRTEMIREIASAVRKGSFLFEPDDRPVLEVGGRKFFIREVGYDMLGGLLTYTLCDADGRTLLSKNGERKLDSLSVDVLRGIREKVVEYKGYKTKREKNLNSIMSRMQMLNMASSEQAKINV